LGKFTCPVLAVLDAVRYCAVGLSIVSFGFAAGGSCTECAIPWHQSPLHSHEDLSRISRTRVTPLAAAIGGDTERHYLRRSVRSLDSTANTALIALWNGYRRRDYVAHSDKRIEDGSPQG